MRHTRRHSVQWLMPMDSWPWPVFFSLIAPCVRDAALKCLALLPRSPEGLAGLAAVEGYYLWNWQDSEKLLKRSIAANPEYETAHHLYAMGCLLPQTRLKEALRQIHRAEEINQLSPF